MLVSIVNHCVMASYALRSSLRGTGEGRKDERAARGSPATEDDGGWQEWMDLLLLFL